MINSASDFVFSRHVSQPVQTLFDDENADITIFQSPVRENEQTQVTGVELLNASRQVGNPAKMEYEMA